MKKDEIDKFQAIPDDFIFINMNLSIIKSEKQITIKAHKTKTGFVKQHKRKVKIVDNKSNNLDEILKSVDEVSVLKSQIMNYRNRISYLEGQIDLNQNSESPNKYFDNKYNKELNEVKSTLNVINNNFNILKKEIMEYLKIANNEDKTKIHSAMKSKNNIKKSEKTIQIKAHKTKKGIVKAHKRKIKIGIKSKSPLDPDNLVEIKSFEDSGINIVPGIHEMETYICKFKDGSNSIHKTMDPGDIIGEVGSFETSKILDWDVIPETIQCDYGKGKGSSQKWIDGEEPMDEFGGSELKEKHFDDLSKIFVLDMILGNFDRHSGNIIISDDKIYGIDNEMIGKRNNAELHIESLEQFVKKGAGSPMPMINILEHNFGNDPKIFGIFKDHVDKNIGEMIKNKDEIIKYWNGYKGLKDTKFMGSIPSDEGIEYIKKNIEYLEKYHGEKK